MSEQLTIKAKCPKCNSEDVKELKSWTIKGRHQRTSTKIVLLLCRNCGNKFRIGIKQ